MIALIKNNKNGLDILCPIPEWVDPVAFSIFDCYGYSLCADYTPPAQDTKEKIIPQFTFSTEVIKNPYRQSDDDPETVIQRTARQIK